MSGPSPPQGHLLDLLVTSHHVSFSSLTASTPLPSPINQHGRPKNIPSWASLLSASPHFLQAGILCSASLLSCYGIAAPCQHHTGLQPGALRRQSRLGRHCHLSEEQIELHCTFVSLLILFLLWVLLLALKTFYTIWKAADSQKCSIPG